MHLDLKIQPWKLGKKHTTLKDNSELKHQKELKKRVNKNHVYMQINWIKTSWSYRIQGHLYKNFNFCFFLNFLKQLKLDSASTILQLNIDQKN